MIKEEAQSELAVKEESQATLAIDETQAELASKANGSNEAQDKNERITMEYCQLLVGAHVK